MQSASNLKLEHLRVFAVVAELGNIREAAARLGRTPSALSMTLKQLEANIGGALFERDRKNSLTVLGRFTLEMAQRQIESFARAEQNIRAFAGNAIGRITVACVPSVAARAMPEILQSFIGAHPRIEIDLRDTDSLTIEAMVEREEVDFGISLPPRPHSPLHFRPLYEEPFYLFCRADSPLREIRRPIAWDDLASETLIRNVGLDLAGSAQYNALASTSRLFVRNTTSLLALVQAGVGVTVLPAMDGVNQTPEIITLPLADAGARQTIGLLSRAASRLAPAAEELKDQVATKLAAPGVIRNPMAA